MTNKYFAGALMLLVLANVACYVRCQDTETPPAVAPDADATSSSSEAPKVEEAQADQATGPQEAADSPTRPPSATESSTPPSLVHNQEAAAAPAAPAAPALPEAEPSHTEKAGHNSTAPAFWPSVSIAITCAVVATGLH